MTENTLLSGSKCPTTYAQLKEDWPQWFEQLSAFTNEELEAEFARIPALSPEYDLRTNWIHSEYAQLINLILDDRRQVNS